MRRLFVIVGLLWCFCLAAAEVIPPAPARYFNDYANVVSPTTASRLNQTLEDFEKQTSSQILVVVYPKMQSDSSIDDYTVRVFRAWKVGQKVKNNGAVLFVFVQDRKLFIQVGYGLEGVLPDARCKQIIENVITPRFKQGDYDGGLSAGVAAMIAAAKGEYVGTGQTVNESNHGGGSFLARHWLLFLIIFLLFVFSSSRGRRSGLGTGWVVGS